MKRESIFQKVETTLRRAFPDLIEMPWDAYGKSIKLIDDSGAPVHQSFFVLHVPAGTAFACMDVFGELPDSGKSFDEAETMINTLACSLNAWASIELRDPPHVWGGALRNHERDYWGLTGLPEVPSHIVLAHTLYYCGALSRSRRDQLLSSLNPGLNSALAHVSMSVKDYKLLVTHINDIILAASM